MNNKYTFKYMLSKKKHILLDFAGFLLPVQTMDTFSEHLYWEWFWYWGTIFLHSL